MAAPPKNFHEVHSSDVRIFHDVARRTKTKCDNGLVFISSPVKPNEKILIKLVQVSNNLPGIISIGFTSHNPWSLHPLSDITRHQLKYTQGFWTCSLSKQYCTTNKILFFYVTIEGTIHFGLDGEEKIKFEKCVNTASELWAFVDIWCPPTTVQIVQNDLKPQSVFDFSYSFTSQPIKIGEQMTITVSSKGNVTFGVTSYNPGNRSVISLPENNARLQDRPEYWIVINEPSWIFEPLDEINCDLTSDGRMKIRKNNILLKEIYVAQDTDLWGFFSMDSVGSIKIQSSILKKVSTIEKIEDDDSSKCIICCDNQLEAALIPCGHLCMCFNCAKKQWISGGDGLCPLCRVKIKDVLKIYKS